MSLSFSANLESFDSLNVRMRWGGELMGLEDALHRSQTHARRLRRHPAGPMAGFSLRRRERQIDHPLHRGRRQRRLAGFARLVAREPFDAFGHETSLPAPHHRLGLAGSAHDLGRAAAVGRCKDDFGAPDMLLRRVGIRHNRFKPTAIVRRDLDRNSRSHHESLNCFGRFGNRPIESDH